MLAISVIVFLVIYSLYSKWSNRIPGPNFFTDIFCGTKITDSAKAQLYQHYLKLSCMFGPIFEVSLDGRKTVVITDPDLAHTALVAKPDDFAGRPQDTMFKNSNQETNDLGTSPYNQRFRLVKKAAGKALWGYMSGTNLERRVYFVCQQLTRMWTEELQSGPFNPAKGLAYPGVGVCLGAMFNTDFSPDDEDYVYVRDNMEAFIHLDTTGSGGTEQLVQKVGDEYPKFMRRKIDEVLATFGDRSPESIVEYLLVEMRENDSSIVREYMKNNMEYLMTDLMGGNITVHSTLIWMVFFMAKYQQVQERIHDEIMRVIGGTSEIRLSHRHKMPYTQAALLEIMRRGTITPIGFPHVTTTDTSIAGYRIPEGTDVTFHFYAFHHNGKYFPDPEKFLPERFIKKVDDETDSSCKTVTVDDIVKPKALMPFSAGRRKCPAEMVAKPELFMILCHLVRTWKIKFPEGTDYTEDYADSNYSVAGLPKKFEIDPELRKQE